MSGHVLVVGAGGIGCPALWGLVAAGAERITVVDHDRVELSNLPRQVLFAEDDVGQPKALAAARAFSDHRSDVCGVHARLDESTFEDLSRGVDVLIDATDGARTKDWLNHAAVYAGIPLVHAAGLRSEARLLVVPAGGRPCLACLFGRLEEETGACADLGVWNGVVGVIGFRAAGVALRLLAGDAPSPTYDVFDFDARRALSLEASADERCPVCHTHPRALEPFPDAAPCAVPVPLASSEAADRVIDLREVRCPMNLLRARQALGEAVAGAVIEFHLGEEGAATVPDGVRMLGHEIVGDEPKGNGRRLRVRASAGAAHEEPLSAGTLERFARQLVLPDFGAVGQRRLGAAAVELTGTGEAAAVAKRYLACAGLGTVIHTEGGALTAAFEGETWRPVARDDGVEVAVQGSPVDASLAVAALLADRVQRYIVAPGDTQPSLALPE